MISWITKLRLKHIASREANGLYGEFLVQRQEKSEENPAVNIDFQPSDWMKSLVDDYTNTVDMLVNKKRTITTLYSKIKQYYAKANEADNEFNTKKAEILSHVCDIEAEIARIDSQITETSQLLSNFHEGKPLPSGLTPRQLSSIKTDLEQQRSQKQTQREVESDTVSIQTERNQIFDKYRNKIRPLESDFSKQIDLLYQRIHIIEIKYNEQISYYREKLCEYLQDIYCEDDNQYLPDQKGNESIANYNRVRQITEPIKQLKDIAPFCGITLPSKKELFKNEREFINTTINLDMGIHYDV